MKLTHLTVGLFLSSTAALASGGGKFPSTVKGLTMDNAHVVSKGTATQGEIVRGAAPDRPDPDATEPLSPRILDAKRVQELKDYGITDVIIFKREVGTEVGREQAMLDEVKIKHMHESFRWRDFAKWGGYELACRQSVRALAKLAEVRRDPSRKAFIHCTVGQDRTGMLMGIWRMMHDGWNATRAFYWEMCMYGYERGNPASSKDPVVDHIRRDLTPLYFELGKMVREGRLTLENIDENVCAGIQVTPTLPSETFQCMPSPMFQFADGAQH